MNPPSGWKDPSVAALLSFCFPGAGFAYIGDIPKFLRVFLTETVLFCLAGQSKWIAVAAIVMHLFFVISAAGAARVRNALLPAPPPPPPLTASPNDEAQPTEPAWSLEAPPPPPPAPLPASSVTPVPPAVSAAPLTPEEFLAELRELWTARAAGTIDDAHFALRKRAAIERVRAADMDDGVALLEATAALVGAGVLTQAERNRLKLRVSRP